jgi:uncharacterized damage-inducible protein DinB
MESPLRQYEILTQAREKLFGWLDQVVPADYTKPFPFGYMNTMRATLLHTASAEWGYTRRLRGEPPTERYFTEERFPAFPELRQAWTEMQPETRAMISAERDWDRSLEFEFTTADGRTWHYKGTAGGQLMQMYYHEVHHRAQIMSMLRMLGVAAQNLDYSAFAFERWEVK